MRSLVTGFGKLGLGRFTITVLVVVAAWLGLASSAFAYTFGGIEYAVLGIGGNVNIESDMSIYQSATVVNGNVGEGPFTLITHGIDATINGKWYFDTNTDASSNPARPEATAGSPCPPCSGGTPVSVTGSVTGGFVSQNMAPVVQAAINQAAADSLLAPTQTFSTLSENQVIVGNGGLNVIRITGDVTLKQGLTIQGTDRKSV